MTTASLARQMPFLSVSLSLSLSLCQFAISSIFSHRMQFLPLLCGISASAAVATSTISFLLSCCLSLSLHRHGAQGALNELRVPSYLGYLGQQRQRWLMQRWMVCHLVRSLGLAACCLQLQQQQLLLLLSLLVCPINPIISCKAMRCCWLDFPVRHDISEYMQYIFHTSQKY